MRAARGARPISKIEIRRASKMLGEGVARTVEAIRLLDLWERFKTTILFITHDVDEAIFLGDRIGVMGRRPGLLKEELDVNLRRPRTIAVTTDQNFVDTKRKILEHLYEEGQHDRRVRSDFGNP